MPDDKFVVHIVDDDDAVRDALQQMLTLINMSVISFDSAHEFLQFVTPETNGCLILDIRMPGMSGLELQKKLRALGYQIPTIFITGHADVPMAVEAIKHGAVDFIEKPFREQQMLDLINRVMEKAKSDHQRNRELKDVHERLSSLSKRERQVLDHITEGHANKVIASELCISQRTVETHRAKLLEKLNVPSTAGLIKLMVLASARDHTAE